MACQVPKSYELFLYIMLYILICCSLYGEFSADILDISNLVSF